MNKAQYRNTEVTGLSVFIRKALVEMSCYGSVIIGSNIILLDKLETELYNVSKVIIRILEPIMTLP